MSCIKTYTKPPSYQFPIPHSHSQKPSKLFLYFARICENIKKFKSLIEMNGFWVFWVFGGGSGSEKKKKKEEKKKKKKEKEKEKKKKKKKKKKKRDEGWWYLIRSWLRR